MTTERPILFSGPMVRAILEGHKTQTRRVVKVGDTIEERDDGTRWPYFTTWTHGDDGSPWASCPYGEPGDRLWVRETWSPWSDVVDCGEAAKLRDARAQMPWACILYGADRVWSKQQPADNGGKWRPSIHMPRWASRLTLAVTAARVERLQAISEADAVAEGIQARCDHGCSSLCGCASCIEDGCQTAAAKYAALWDAINGDRAAWASNPWVWVVEFKRVTEGATAP